MGMYAKLMSRITESSLMDEDIVVRYSFMMLLAIADPQGYVVGTDVAIARRLNMPLSEFKRCIEQLMAPDPDSNSMEEEGRRVILSDCERGYYLVNYTKYRDTRDEEQRRNYMREYMRKRRGSKDVTPVNSGKQRKPRLAKADAEVKADAKVNPPNPQGGNAGKDNLPTSEFSKRIAGIFHRKLTTPWTDAEIRSYRKLRVEEEDLRVVEEYYQSEIAKGDDGRHRRDLGTFLNNYPGEVDRAKAWKSKPSKPNGTNQHLSAHNAASLNRTAAASYREIGKKLQLGVVGDGQGNSSGAGGTAGDAPSGDAVL